MADAGLLEAVRGLRLAHPELAPKPLLAKLRQQQPDLAAGNKEVREALGALRMQAFVLSGHLDAWAAGPRSAAELREAAAHFERAAALQPAPAVKAALAADAAWCRSRAEPSGEE